MIQSIPSGAKIYVDGQPMGLTPCTYSDTKIVGSTTTVQLEKEGYDSFYSTFSRDEQVDIGAAIGGFLVWIPFLWVMKYNPVHIYELIPSQSNEQTITPSHSDPIISKSRNERLREIKQLLDENILTQEEVEKEKKKILEEYE